MKSVYSAVRTGSLNKAVSVSCYLNTANISRHIPYSLVPIHKVKLILVLSTRYVHGLVCPIPCTSEVRDLKILLAAAFHVFPLCTLYKIPQETKRKFIFSLVRTFPLVDYELKLSRITEPVINMLYKTLLLRKSPDMR